MIGIDLVSIDRIENLVKKYQKKFLQRFLNKSEINLVSTNNGYNIQRIAGFYASKEALSKAFGCGIGARLNFHHIKIQKNSNNSPNIKLTKYLKKEFKVKKINISISHDKDYAIATALIKYK
ncbi:holo-ACP synthase [Helicobacter sp. MIT 14-3879]|uniref:holo-ACP synthase n=1 Tax=Helicobacter sp. MIT 14-3879 TaxID=2040649 RepID=UPI000E1EB2A8|nr:holo-ACP synthase [Helicobacter sp. MIT 14-3879]RDU65201.1 holo-ACP synthase [Helicobacter sp. MIT 14-3879]